MKEEIRSLLAQLAALEEELQAALHKQEDELSYRIEGTRIAFGERIREAHVRLRVGLLPWLLTSNPRNLLSAPVIYSMIVPLAIADVFFTVYQWLCFPLYRIPRVRRSVHIVIDRHQLSYLNIVEKLNCVFCGYANGLISYMREITARTEQYWCPIKHARKIASRHSRYAQFLDFGDAQDYQAELIRLREALGKTGHQ